MKPTSPDLPTQGSDSARDPNWDQVWEAFHVLVEADGAERPTLLERLERPERREVESLLAAHEGAGTFLDGLPAGVLPPGAPTLGTRIGPYRVRELLGAGGMGLVYLAEQEEPIRRRVALKLPGIVGAASAGTPTSEIAERFDTERQTLALLSHPGIATCYEAGTTGEGQPWMAMEHVDGRPIDIYCRHHALPVAKRLELFSQLCDAVAHAHARGIVHRDLKPANVLVAQRDGEAVVKVIDFGIAKTLGVPSRTRLDQRLGTPSYMSPEQHRGAPVDARADVYALGLILQELEPPRRLRGVVVRALAHDPGQRPANAADLWRVIEHSPLLRPSLPAALAALGVLVLVLALALWSSRQTPSSPGQSTAPDRLEAPRVRASPERPTASEAVRTVALTIDDVPDNGSIALEASQAINAAILSVLDAHDIPATVFVNPQILEREAREAILADWLARGHRVGNHGDGHLHLTGTRVEDYFAAIQRAELPLERLLAPHGRTLRYFRPPYLETGADLRTRQKLDAYLREAGYTLAPVTFELTDYLYAAAYTRYPARAEELRAAFLEHTEERVDFFEKAAVDLFGRDIAHVLLLHANQLTADSLEGLVELLKARRYRFVPLDEAMRDPAYSVVETYVGRYGAGWLQRWAEALGQSYAVSREPEAPSWVAELAQ